MKKSQLNLIFILLIFTLTILFINFIDYKIESDFEENISQQINLSSKAWSGTCTLTRESILCGIMLILSIPTYFIIRKKIKG